MRPALLWLWPGLVRLDRKRPALVSGWEISDICLSCSVIGMSCCVALTYPQALPPCAVTSQLADDVTAMFKEKISSFKVVTPMIVDLGNPAMRPRHWAKLYKALGQVCMVLHCALMHASPLSMVPAFSTHLSCPHVPSHNVLRICVRSVGWRATPPSPWTSSFGTTCSPKRI